MGHTQVTVTVVHSLANPAPAMNETAAVRAEAVIEGRRVELTANDAVSAWGDEREARAAVRHMLRMMLDNL